MISVKTHIKYHLNQLSEEEKEVYLNELEINLFDKETSIGTKRLLDRFNGNVTKMFQYLEEKKKETLDKINNQ